MKPTVTAPPAALPGPTMQDVRPVKAELVAPIPVKAAPGSVPEVNSVVKNPVLSFKTPTAQPQAKADKHLDKVLKEVNQQVKDPNWLKKPKNPITHAHVFVPIVLALLASSGLIYAAVVSFQ